jgi:hypothetical protein
LGVPALYIELVEVRQQALRCKLLGLPKRLSTAIPNAKLAKLKGMVKLKGIIDDLTFYNLQDGYIVKQKTSLDSNHIKTDSAYVRTRENISEFSTAVKDGKLQR